MEHVLNYLGLNAEYQPSPIRDPIQFLAFHIYQLPSGLLLHFSAVTTPQQRTSLPAIRNRRLRWANSQPEALSLDTAKVTWPNLWPGNVGEIQSRDEKNWVQQSFRPGQTQHIGKLGDLLADYEVERVRGEPARNTFVPEEDDDSEDEDESEADIKATFQRIIKERFIYGLLDVSLCVINSIATR